MGDAKSRHIKDHRRNRARQVHNVEEVAPAGLRLVMREQMAKAVRHYDEADGLGVAAG